MPVAKLLILIAVFFLTSLVSMVTGSTSLITVPVLIAVGIETNVAIAANMLALTFPSAGGFIPYHLSPSEKLSRARAPAPHRQHPMDRLLWNPTFRKVRERMGHPVSSRPLGGNLLLRYALPRASEYGNTNSVQSL